jgi:hypothetical protein
MNIRIDKTSMICLALVASVYIVSTHTSWVEDTFALAGKICLEAIL